MNKLKNTLLIALLGAFTVLAQTNAPALNLDTADGGKSESGGWELTLGGSGVTVDGDTEFGFDFSLSTNPFEKLPSIWVGVAQGVAWEPKLGGTTDVFVDWSTHVYRDLYVNTGWSAGALYAADSSVVWRTGPEVTLQWYVGDNAFVYAGANYDLVEDGDGGFRYSFGVGLAF